MVRKVRTREGTRGLRSLTEKTDGDGDITVLASSVDGADGERSLRPPQPFPIPLPDPTFPLARKARRFFGFPNPWKPAVRKIALAILVLSLAACVHVTKSVLTREFEADPVPMENVAVWLASMNDSIPSDCTRVAILHASGDQDFTDESDMLDELRQEAGKLGANAIFVQNMEDASTGERVVAEIFDTEADRDADAVALHCPPGL